LATVRDASGSLGRLLQGGYSAIASRLVGAFRNIGRERIADDILRAMWSAGYTVRKQDPFATKLETLLPARERSPYAGRIRLMWREVRGAVVERFPPPPGRPAAIDAYLQRVHGSYVTDAYDSLSIEGCRVSPELIERVRSGTWDWEADEQDGEYKDGLAARGNAFMRRQRPSAA
jgi:hypothetical protein